MNKQEWNEGLNQLDPDLVEKYVAQKDLLRQKKNTKSLWLRIGALAACFALIVSAIFVVPMLRKDGSGIIAPPNNHTPIMLDATAYPEKLTGSNSVFVVGSSSALDGGGSSAPPIFQFSSGIIAKAKVVRNYPDKYYKLDTNPQYSPTAYRLIQMETLAVISGENVPQYFLYLIPEHLYVDMSVYDSLLISMVQRGAENYVLKNETQSQIEALAFPVFADRFDHPELGTIIAFSSGIFDESLWQNDSWRFGYQFAKYYLDNPQYSKLVVARGSSESEAIAAIINQYGANRKTRAVITLNFKTQEAKDALEYVKPFANGVFCQSLGPYYSSTANYVIFMRYINGCQTEETIKIDLLTEEVTYSQVRYTKEDLAQMENISIYLAEKAADYKQQQPTPPHIDPEGKDLLCLQLYGWYAKVDGKLYGVIKTAWCYHEEDHHLQYYDEAFVLYDMSAGTASDISREDLVTIVGTRNVYMDEYGPIK